MNISLFTYLKKMGSFLKGSFFLLLPLMLAFGLTLLITSVLPLGFPLTQFGSL